MAYLAKVYVHFQNDKVIGISSNSDIALNFLNEGKNRRVEKWKVQAMTGRNIKSKTKN